MASEFVEAFAPQALAEPFLVTVVFPLPEGVSQAGLTYGDEREKRMEVFLSPVARDIESPADDVTDAAFDRSLDSSHVSCSSFYVAEFRRMDSTGFAGCDAG